VAIYDVEEHELLHILNVCL